MKTLTRFTLALAALALACFHSTATADTKTWTGGALLNDRWRDKDNWSGDTAPVAGDSLFFGDAAITDLSINNDFPAGTSFGFLRFERDGYEVKGNAFVPSTGILGEGTVVAPVKTRIIAPLTLASDQFISWTHGALTFGDAYESTQPIPQPPDQTIDTAGHRITVAGFASTVLFDRVSGTGGITIGTAATPGQAVMTDLSSYSGVTTVVNGRLFVDDGANLGSTAGKTIVQPEGLLDLETTTGLTEPIDLEGTLVGSTSLDGVPSFAGPLTLVGSGEKTVRAAASVFEENTFTLTGRISGSGTLIAGDSDDQPSAFVGLPTVILLAGATTNTATATLEIHSPMHFQKPAGVPAWSGPVVVADEGTLKLLANEQIADTSSLTVQAGGLADLNGKQETVGALDVCGVVQTGAGRLTVDGDITTLGGSFTPVINGHLRIAGTPRVLHVTGSDAGDDLIVNADLQAFAGGQTLVKNGNGSVLFTGGGAPMTFQLDDGAVVINGAHNGTTVQLNGGELRGVGVVGIVQSASGGKVAPGPSGGVGQLVCTTIAWNPATTFEVEMLSAAPATHDQIAVNFGGVNLGGAALALTLLPGFTPSLNQEFTLIENDGTDPVVGTFAGLTNGAQIVTASGVKFTVHYNGGTGNDVVLRTTFTPPTGITRVWDGNGAGNFWETAVNWSNNIAPANGDALVFPANAVQRTNVNRVQGGLTNVAWLRFTGDDYDILSVPLNLINGLTNASPDGSANKLTALLQLRADQSWFVATRTRLTLGNNVAFPALPHALTLDGPGTLQLDGSFLGNASVSLLKRGAGTLELNGNSNTVGSFIVAGGAVNVNGFLDAAIVISNVARLQGTGSVSFVTCAGDMRPGGAAAGALSFRVTNSPAFLPGARLFMDLNGPTPGADYDQLRTVGTVSLTGVLLNIAHGASTPFVAGEKFVIVNNTADSPAFDTTFANLLQDSRLTNNGVVFQISYSGGDGNDVELTVVEAPSLNAVTRVWDGGGAPDTRWLRASNWVSEVVPSANEALQFPASSPTNTPASLARWMTNDFPAGTAFHQLQFDGPDWRVSGNGLALLNGLSASNGQGIPLLVFAPITLLAPQAFAHFQPAVTDLQIRGPVNLGGHTLRIEGDAPVGILGPISGNGGLVMNNTSRLDFTLGTTQSFTGGLIVSNGLVNSGSVNAPGTPWVVRAGELKLIGGSIPGLIAASGRVTTTGKTEVLSDVNLAAGTTFAIAAKLGELRVHSSVQLGGATLELLPVFGPGPTGEEIVLVNNDGADAAAGTFANIPEGGILSGTFQNGFTTALFRISYAGGDGNDVTLTRLPAPATHVTKIWDGGGANGFWLNGANWAGNVAPAPGDDLQFPANAARLENTNNILATGFSANSVLFTGDGYTVRGATPDGNLLALHQSVTCSNAAGTNILTLPLFFANADAFHVAHADATLVLDGHVISNNVVARGPVAIRKTGAGALELRDGVVRTGDGLEINDGLFRLNNALVEGALTVSNAVLEAVSGEAGQLVAHSATVRLLRTTGLPTTLTVSNLAFDVASTLELHYTSTNGVFPPSPALELIESGLADLGNATLDVQLDSPLSFGDKLVVLHNPGTNAIVGTFANLPEGGVLVAAGRPWRITYTGAPTGRDIVLRGEELRLVITGIERAADGLVTIAGTAEPNRTLIIEVTEDFVQYKDLGSAPVNAAGAWKFSDANAATLPHRFYRARYQ